MPPFKIIYHIRLTLAINYSKITKISQIIFQNLLKKFLIFLQILVDLSTSIAYNN